MLNITNDMKLIRKLYSHKVKLIGGLTGLAGISLLGSVNKRKLTGLENFYHSTDSKNVDGIMKDGIKSEYSVDPNNITNNILKDTPMNEKEGLIYLGRKKWVADTVGKSRDKKLGTTSKTLNINIPYKDFKKMILVENPEIKGIKNSDEYIKMIYQQYLEKKKKNPNIKPLNINNPLTRLKLKKAYYMLGDKGTSVVRGDIDSKFIENSNNYEKYDSSQFKDYIKNNPRRFGKEAAKIIGGTSLIGTGVYLAKKLR